jgi:L-fuconolactonase
MKPQIHAHSAEMFQVWADGMAALARDTKAYLKFSALVTEANEGWTVEDLRPYADHVFACFGAERIMWGSDWPVCRLRAEYDAWRHAAEELTKTLTAEERARVFGGTAAEAYRLAL